MPLRRSLLTRLLAASVLVAVCSVAATTWLAVTTTTREIRIEQGQSLAEDARIYDSLIAYAATHPRWDGVETLVRELSGQTGRAITLTTAGRARIAGSEKPGELPRRPSALVDPLRLDPALSDKSGPRIDARAVGPYKLPAKEREALAAQAADIKACLTDRGFGVDIDTAPSGRPAIRLATPDFKGIASICGVGTLGDPMPSEQQPLKVLSTTASDCLERQGMEAVIVGGDFSFFAPNDRGNDASQDKASVECIEEARRQQLKTYVAAPALLFVGAPGGPDPTRFDLSSTSRARLGGAAALVLAVTLLVTVVVGLRLVRPLRTLIAAAQRPADEAVRVSVRSNDEIGYLTAAFNDLTERRELLEQQRRSMVSDVAHELRSPLTNIRSWLEAAQDGITPANEDLIALLLDEAVLLQHVIDDLRDLAAADADRLTLHHELLSAGDVLEYVAAAHRGAADVAGVRVEIESADDTDFPADALRLRQVIGNLVSNAIRHTPRGGAVTLRSRVDGDRVVMEVADTGSGIGPDDLPQVFDRFWRSDKSRNRHTGGSGLGLAIARKLTEAHGGSISAISTLGVGSTFTIRLPRT